MVVPRAYVEIAFDMAMKQEYTRWLTKTSK